MGTVYSFMLDNQDIFRNIVTGRSNQLPDFGDMPLIKKFGLELPLMYESNSGNYVIKGKITSSINNISVNNAFDLNNHSTSIKLDFSESGIFKLDRITVDRFGVDAIYNNIDNNESYTLGLGVGFRFN